MSMLYLRDADDMFLIWKRNYDYLTNILHNINKQHPNIKSDFVISKETVSSLDTKIEIFKPLFTTKKLITKAIYTEGLNIHFV